MLVILIIFICVDKVVIGNVYELNSEIFYGCLEHLQDISSHYEDLD